MPMENSFSSITLKVMLDHIAFRAKLTLELHIALLSPILSISANAPQSYQGVSSLPSEETEM